jgi:hypothetical protein
MIIFIGFLFLPFGCSELISSEEKIFSSLQEYSGHNCDMIYIYSPYDCELCTSNAKGFVLQEKSKANINICYLIFSKKKVKPYQYLVFESDTIVPVIFFDKKIYNQINNITLDDKFPVILRKQSEGYSIIEF